MPGSYVGTAMTASLRAMRRRRPWWLTAIAATAVVLFVAWLGVLIAVVVVGSRDEAAPADAIVVLGAAQYEGRPSPVLRARLDHALALYEQKLAPVLIVTGGTGRGDTTSEAAVGQRFLEERGVPDSAVIMEATGRTTSQSLHAVAAIMQSRSERVAILVSDPFHMLRLWILAKRLGLTPRTSPTRTSPISAHVSSEWKYIFAESFKAPLAYLFDSASD